MSNLKQLNSEVEFVDTLKLIAQAFEEISVLRMRRVRTSVLSAREFVANISTVFYDVKNSYKGNILQLRAKQKKAAEVEKNNRPLTVLLSANNKLYGGVVTEVFEQFAEWVKEHDTDILIVGRLGKDLYEESKIGKPYMFFDLTDAEVTAEDIKPIVFNIVRYESISVFYAQFSNVLTQTPLHTNITGDEPFNVLLGKGQAEKQVKFLFEPNIDEILEFFQKQVFTALFKQTVQEAHLAHFASRVTAMEQALVHIDSRSKILYIEERKAKKMLENKRTLERIAGMQLWK